jgi:citrate lyase synthetase
MTVRFYKSEDAEAIKQFVEKHKINFNLENRIIVIAEDENGNIKSIGAIRSVAFIEPLISENALATFKTYTVLMQLLEKMNQPIVRCFTSPSNKELFEKFDFEEVFQDQIIMEKNLI